MPGALQPGVAPLPPPFFKDTNFIPRSYISGKRLCKLMALRDDICSAMENYMMNAPSDWNTITVEEVKKEIASQKNILILDVRERDEFAAGHIQGAINISVRELPDRVKELPHDKDMKIITYCASGIRSAYATMFLRVYGYADVSSLVHGIREWTATGNRVIV